MSTYSRVKGAAKRAAQAIAANSVVVAVRSDIRESAAEIKADIKSIRKTAAE